MVTHQFASAAVVLVLAAAAPSALAQTSGGGGVISEEVSSLLIGPPAPPPPSSLCVEMRNLDDSCGGDCGVWWRIALAPRGELFEQVWQERQVRRGLPLPAGAPRGGCAETAEVFVVGTELTRGELQPLDLNCDGAVGGDDLGLLATALSGPGTPTGGNALCRPTDYNDDGDTDLRDFAELMLSGGPGVPVRLDYAVDADPWTALFGDQDVVPGGPADTFGWAGGTSSLTLRARAAFPTFGNSWFDAAVLSDDPDRVIMLTDGADLSLLLQTKMVQPAFAGQSDLATLLAPWLNGSIVTLPADEFLILFELDTAYAASPSYDFQDLVVRVRSSCAVGSEIVLRDSIGPDTSWTNGNFGFVTGANPGQSPSAIVYPVSSTQPVILSSLRAISHQALGTPGNFCWFPAGLDMDYRVSIWSSLAAVQANNVIGDEYSILHEEPSAPLVQFGTTAVYPFYGSYLTYDGSYDLLAGGVELQPGEEKWLSLIFTPSADHGCSIIESREEGASDLRVQDDGTTTLIVDEAQSTHSGRVAVEIRGVTF